MSREEAYSDVFSSDVLDNVLLALILAETTNGNASGIDAGQVFQMNVVGTC